MPFLEFCTVEVSADFQQGAILTITPFSPTLIGFLLASRKPFCGAHLPEEIQMKSYTALSWLGNAAKHPFIV